MRTSALIAGLVLVSWCASSAPAQLLYATGSAVGGQNRYYSIDPATGVATALSPPSTPTQATTTTGLAFDPSGVAFGVTNAGRLVRPNFTNNTFADVGPLGFNPPGIPINAAGLEILADGRAFTYQTNEFSPLFQINLSTGAVTGIGYLATLTDVIIQAGGNLSTVDQPIVTGMGSIGGTLYAIENKTSTLVAVDPATGDVVVPTGQAGQLKRGNLVNGNARNRYITFAGLTGYDSNNDGQYDRLLATVNTFDGARFGGLIEINPATGSWELIGTGNAPLNFFALGSPLGHPPTCVADVDDGSMTGTPDGGVTIDDLLYYLYIFDQGLLAADVDDGSGTGTHDGGVTIDDLLYFLYRFDLGC